MISISSIKTYMYCPLKLYLQNIMDEKTNNEFLLNKAIKDLRTDLQDLFQRNLRRLKKDMTIAEIEENLSKNVEEYIENSIATIKTNKSKISDENKEKEPTDDEEELQKLSNDIKEESLLNLKILSLKSKKVMVLNEKDGEQIAEYFFPSSMYSYLMRDSQLEIIGSCDKIEIVDGRYYPINIKSSKPPIKGVWDNDAIELVANALLIEQEFDTEVFVGFVEYLKVGDRRPVVMDSNLRKGLFKVLNEIKDIINENITPEVNMNKGKCMKCDYEEICQPNF